MPGAHRTCTVRTATATASFSSNIAATPAAAIASSACARSSAAVTGSAASSHTTAARAASGRSWIPTITRTFSATTVTASACTLTSIPASSASSSSAANLPQLQGGAEHRVQHILHRPRGVFGSTRVEHNRLCAEAHHGGWRQ